MKRYGLLVAAFAALLALLFGCAPVDPAPPAEPPAIPPQAVAPTEAPAAMPGASSPLLTAIVTVLPEASPTSQASGETAVQPPADSDPRPFPRPTMPGAAYDDATCFTAAELQTLPPSELAALKQVCFQTDGGELLQVGQSAAIGTIQQAMADPALGLRFTGVTSMGNSPNGDLRVAQFEDRLGRLFSVLPGGSRLMEIDPGRYSIPSSGASLSQDELRQKAEAFITRLDPDFVAVRDKLAFSGGAKATFAFFRWEDASAQGWTSMPPLAQVGITPQGEVFSYINTLFLVR